MNIAARQPKVETSRLSQIFYKKGIPFFCRYWPFHLSHLHLVSKGLGEFKTNYSS